MWGLSVGPGVSEEMPQLSATQAEERDKEPGSFSLPACLASGLYLCLPWVSPPEAREGQFSEKPSRLEKRGGEWV